MRHLYIYSFLFITSANGFNFDIKHPVIIADPNAGYFGYSVLLQKGTPSFVIVGAPRSNSSYHQELHEPGTVWGCSITTKDTECSEYLVDKEGNNEHRNYNSRYNFKHKKDGQLLGAAIDGGDNYGDPLILCAPRWINERVYGTDRHYLVNGICYVLENSTNYEESARYLMPLLRPDNQGYSLNGVGKYFYALGQAGFSLDYIQSTQELLLGAPGVLSWKGTVVRYPDGNTSIFQENSRWRMEYSPVNVPHPVFIPSLKNEFSYLGYAITHGRFTPYGISYAAGAPRADDLNGLVIIYKYAASDDYGLETEKILYGDQIGAYFGATLAAFDTSSNNISYLLIGAPTYTTKSWDEGCVYIYHPDEEQRKIYGGGASGGRFGTAISVLGDRNHNSHSIVAISAPYEDSGVVYIYLFDENGLNNEYSQRVEGKALYRDIRGFGFSLSKGVDIDNNLYNDVAIGAYLSTKVIVLKSRPIIQFVPSITASLDELLIDSKEFTVSYCLLFLSQAHAVEFVEASIEIVKDRRFNENVTFTSSILVTRQDQCVKETIVLKNGWRVLSKPYQIEMSYKIMENKTDGFCPNCPVLNPNDITSHILEIPFADGCGIDKVCQTNVKLSASFPNLSALILGSTNPITLKTVIENTGEPAYLCKIHLNLPSHVRTARIARNCLIDANKLDCLVNDVLPPHTIEEREFLLDVNHLYVRHSPLMINIFVACKGEDVDMTDNTVELELPLIYQADIDMSGAATPSQLGQESSQEIIFTHELFIRNLGPSPLYDIRLYIDVPVWLDAIKFVDVDIKEAHLDGEFLQCNTIEKQAIYNNFHTLTVNSNFNSTDVFLPQDRTFIVNCSMASVKCVRFSCNGEMVTKNTLMGTINVEIKAQLRNLTQTIFHGKNIIMFASNVSIAAYDKIYQTNIGTIIFYKLDGKAVSYLVIIPSICAGLLALLALAYILHKIGYFRRPMREKLVNEINESSSNIENTEESQ